MNKSTKNGYYKLKTKDGDKWLHFSRLFISKLKEVSGKDINEFGEFLKSLDGSLDINAQFDAMTDLVMAGMLAYDEKEGNDTAYTLYNVGEWLHYACEEDESVLQGVFDALNGAMPKPGKKRAGRFTPPKK